MTEWKLGSLFDGSGACPLAATMCGIEPMWASEIEPFPIAVTKSRFPNMKHLGDITKLHGGEIPPVDVITFGSPCQNLSIAGNRKGLEGDQSSLFLDAIRIIHEMKEATNGKYPKFAMWENVVGAFSSNRGEDFRRVVEEFCCVCEPDFDVPMPASGKWGKAGVVMGNGWSFGWRTLDAQYWGVPQRRRRIYAVLDLGGGRAGEILFKREGLRGDFKARVRTRQGIADAAEDRTGKHDGMAVYALEGNGQRPSHLGIGGGGDSAMVVQGANCYNQVLTGDKTMTLCASRIDPHKIPTVVEPHVFGVCSKDSNSMKSANPNSGFYEADTTRTLDENGGNPTCNQGGMAVVDGKACGFYLQQKAEGTGFTEEKSVTFVPHGYQNGVEEGYVPYTLRIRAGCEGGGKGALIQTDLSGTLGCNNDQTLFEPYKICDGVIYLVRRLTPTECASLQGFPKDWCALVDHKDTPEYKMWGNGMALPCVLYVMEGIADALKEEQWQK